MISDDDDSIRAIGESLEELSSERPVTDDMSIENSGNTSRPSTWSKEVQHLQLQESGYQNKYIWVKQRYCVECETA